LQFAAIIIECLIVYLMFPTYSFVSTRKARLCDMCWYSRTLAL